MKTIPESIDLATLIKENKWKKPPRFEIRGAMTTPVVNGSVTMQAAWAADIYRPGERKCFFTLVCKEDETPADLFRQLAGLYEAGEVKVGKS